MKAAPQAPWVTPFPALVVLSLAACATPEELASGPPRTPAETLAALEERTGKVRSLYGVVEIAYDGPDREGTFDAIVHWRAGRAGGELRLTAYKDLFLAAPDVFDLLLLPGEWALVADDHALKRRGPRAELPASEPRFAAIHWAGEAMFLAGLIGTEPRVAGEGERRLLRTTLSSGAAAVWTVDPRTLAVPEGEVIAPDGRRIALRFSDWKAPAAGVLLPGRVELHDPTGETRMEMRLQEYELDPALADELFSPDAVLESD